MDSSTTAMDIHSPSRQPSEHESLDAIEKIPNNHEQNFTNTPPWRLPNAQSSFSPPPQFVPLQFLQPDISTPGRQNQCVQPLSRVELESVLGEFLQAIKAENDGLRKEVNNLRLGMNNLCQEMRSTFIAQRPVQVSSHTEKNNHIEAIIANDQRRKISPCNGQSSLPPRPPPTNANNPNFSPHFTPIPNPAPQASSNSAKAELYSQVATANPDKQWTEVKSSKNNFRKVKNADSFPAPLKTPRPERERRIIFRRRVNIAPLSR